MQTRLGLAALTAIGLALRLVGIDQSLYGDEGYTFGIVDGHGLGAVSYTHLTLPTNREV